LNQYLPAAMNPTSLHDSSAKPSRSWRYVQAQMGAVMKALGPKVAGRADGKTLSQEVQKQLG
jgi:uncharacterized protein YqeY